MAKLWLKALISGTQRSLVLSSSVKNDVNLVFSSSNVTQDGKLILDIKVLNDAELLALKPVLILNRPVFGCLGIVRLKGEDFLAIIEDASFVRKINGDDTYQITNVVFFSLSGKYIDLYEQDESREDFSADDVFCENSSIRHRSSSLQLNSHPCMILAKLLCQGTFYFSLSSDISLFLQASSGQTIDWNKSRKEFIWNNSLLQPLFKFYKFQNDKIKTSLQSDGFFPIIMQGFIGASSATISGKESSLVVISRIGNKRFGPKYLHRGLDDSGHVANYVETETILESPDFLMSYVIIRGSVPVFWDQQSSQSAKVQFNRSPVAAQPAFNRHIQMIKKRYGLINAIDLLDGSHDDVEQTLSDAFKYHSQKIPNNDDTFSFTPFDINFDPRIGIVQRLEELFVKVSHEIPVFSYFVKENSGRILRRQKGIFRVSCFDCIEKTNIVQSFLSAKICDLFIRNYLVTKTTQHTYDIRSDLNEIWAGNGDQLSVIFTGKSVGVRTNDLVIKGLMSDIGRSSKRVYTNTVVEDSKQEAVKTMLGTFADSEVVLLSDIFNIETVDDTELLLEATMESLIIKCTTWNINGLDPKEDALKIFLKDENGTLSFPRHFGFLYYVYRSKGKQPDIFVVAFQELVELSAAQIISVDPQRKLMWESKITSNLRSIHGLEKYALLASNQLVGTTISIFAKCDLLPDIRNVEASKIMTGLGGMAGNKGSVAVWLDVQLPSMCFICSHLAAGQSNYSDRNNDWKTAFHDLASLSGRSVTSQDYIFWMGDLNYRLDCSRDVCMKLISERQFEVLQQFDQLSKSMKSGTVFEGFFEPPIAFSPTYKYDPGTNVYDTSEKARVPSWTDRILFKGPDNTYITVIKYSRFEIDFSDHKPVCCVIQIKLLDQGEKKKLAQKQFTLNMVNSSPNLERQDGGSNLLLPNSGSFDLKGLSPNDLSGLEALKLGKDILLLF